ncbi:hypothetical protein FFLO_02740 [Filobasidium floriforme]|uniref:Uncharacterized protein n=1 Tax=Filobasidium floriforme TaxID=5210 RepID=A0A8K0JM39_9TREE|nr:uncharacterized protein HD553DRAFT_313523 [Filobasidium floriforme]KAG7561839.1 hypothetical protein FFLO_02740 [Filobasidium floriforme]KAH8083237.1 hypothetical protein HD553DRAFT_313523 [Filobasidium floriforme]
MQRNRSAIQANECDLIVPLYRWNVDDESAQETDGRVNDDDQIEPDDESEADYQPFRVSDGDEQKEKDVPKIDVAAVVGDKQENKNKEEVTDKKEGQLKDKESTPVIDDDKEKDEEDDLVIIDAADQSLKEDKKAATDQAELSLEGIEAHTKFYEQWTAAICKQIDKLDKSVEGAHVKPTKQHATAGEVDRPPITKANPQNNTEVSHFNQVTSLPPPRPAGEINLEMFKYSTDVWYRAHRDIIELHKELLDCDPEHYMKHCTLPTLSLPPPVPLDTAGLKPGLFSDSDGV